MNKIVVGKSFTLNRVGDIKANPQKYIVNLKKIKTVAIIACDAGERIINIMAR